MRISLGRDPENENKAPQAQGRELGEPAGARRWPWVGGACALSLTLTYLSRTAKCNELRLCTLAVSPRTPIFPSPAASKAKDRCWPGSHLRSGATAPHRAVWRGEEKMTLAHGAEVRLRGSRIKMRISHARGPENENKLGLGT